jgi:hypothetical protein
MRTLLLMFGLGLALAPAKEIATEYKAGVARKITIEAAVYMETTSMEIERDGEKQDGFGGSSTDTERTEIHVDQVLEAEDGKPTKVRRQFVEVGGNSAMEFGETSRESELESPWKGVTIELTPASEGKSDAEVVAGTEPSGDGALEGHAIGLFLDGFLPSTAVEEGGEWDIGSAAIVRGLRLDVQRKLFPPPARGEGREGGGGGGRRGGRGFGGGGGSDSILAQSEWKGTGKFAGTEDKGGVTCAVIELELETSGDAKIERGGGGPGGRALTIALDNRRTWSAKLTGKLWFDTAAKRPVQLEVAGSMQEETNTESDRGGSTMRIHAVREGKIEYSVEVEDAPAEEAKKKS